MAGRSHSFNTGDVVEVDTANVRAIARVRESSDDGRLHVALEVGEYLPWVDENVLIRHYGNDPACSCTAKILHAGATTALLQIVTTVVPPPPPESPRPSVVAAPAAPSDPDAAVASIDDDW